MPATLFGFGLAMAVLWLYLSLADTDAAPQPRVVTVDEPVLPGMERTAGRRPAAVSPPKSPELNPVRTILANASSRIEDNGKSPSRISTVESLRRWKDRSMAGAGRAMASLDDGVNRLKSNWKGTPTARGLEGWRLLEEGRVDRALESFDRALELDASDVAALSGRAAALVAGRRFAEARDAYRSLVEMWPGNASALYNLGVLEGRLGRLDESARYLRAAVEADPKHARAWFNLASLAERDGRLGEAREAWEKFTALQPAMAAGWFNLGIVYMDFQRPEDAARCFSYVVMIDPTDVDGFVNLAAAYRANGDFDSALGILRQADQLSPCDAVVMESMAATHRSLASLHMEGEAQHLSEAERLEAAISEMIPPPPEEEVAADPSLEE